MAKKEPRKWMVAPHGALEKHEDNLWSIDGVVPFIPGGGFRRRMSIVRRADGKLVFYNAVPVDDAALDAIRALGSPAYLVISHKFHMVDAHPFREKLGLAVYAPAATLDEVRAGVEVAGTHADLPPDPAIRVETTAGVRTGDGTVVVSSGDGGARTTLLVGDIALNLRHGRGFYGWLWKRMGFTSDTPVTSPMWKKRAVEDKAAFRADLERLATTPNLVRIIPTHGAPIEQDAPGTLRRLAASV